ncbi:MAG: hypothetical protein FWH20_10965 [Oscillospiraceae bacterium]|nr:hypothetical protein [Oscillospiraceae bacterium]
MNKSLLRKFALSDKKIARLSDTSVYENNFQNEENQKNAKKINKHKRKK